MSEETQRLRVIPAANREVIRLTSSSPIPLPDAASIVYIGITRPSSYSIHPLPQDLGRTIVMHTLRAIMDSCNRPFAHKAGHFEL